MMEVVVIDDDAAILRSLEILLSAHGHRVRAFDDADAACESIARDLGPDVLILDYVVPPTDGAAIMRRLRPHLPDSCRVILISGHTDLVEPLSLDTIGVDAFLPKPLDIDRLCELVEERSLKH